MQTVCALSLWNSRRTAMGFFFCAKLILVLVFMARVFLSSFNPPHLGWPAYGLGRGADLHVDAFGKLSQRPPDGRGAADMATSAAENREDYHVRPGGIP